MIPANYSFRRASRHLFLAVSTVTGLGFGSLQAAEIIKANNTTPLNDAASWVGAVVPGANDIAVFDSSFTAGGAISLAENLVIRGIKAPGLAADVTLLGGIGQSLTLGAGGLDLSGGASGIYFELDTPVILAPGASQTWKVGSGVEAVALDTLTTSGASLTFDFSGANTGVFYAEGFGTVGQLIPGVFHRSGAGLNFATIDATRKIIAADALGQPNPSDGGNPAVNADLLAAPPTGSYLDVVNSNGLASATAFRALRSGSSDAGTFWNDAGIRFAHPHATEGVDWTVDVTQRILYPNNGVFSILVTDTVGAHNVIFNGGSNGNAFRYNNNNASMVVHQQNTAADLILRTSFSARGSHNNFVKGGPGRLIMGNSGYGSAGTSTIYLAEGVTQLGESNATGTFGNLPIVNNGTLRIQRSDVFTFGSALSGSGDLEVAMGSGNLLLTGANTFTGGVTLESGTLTLSTADSLGAVSSITLEGGAVAYAAGVTKDISTVPVSITGPVALDLGANNVSLAGSIGAGGEGSLTKTGAGKLTLTAGNTYTGGTTISAGELSVTNAAGSATGTGSVSVAGGAVLSGTGTVAGAVSTAVGTKIVPGSDGVGTLTVGSLSLVSGSLLDVELASPSSHDRVVVTGGNGLTINGGGIQLLTADTGEPYAAAGSYNLFQYSGSVQGAGASALSVLNPQAGYSYNFAASGGNVTLQIILDAILSQWSATGAGSWGAAGNWSNGVPAGGYTALFTSPLSAPATITLDGARTVNGMAFNSANGYTLAAGSGGTLTFSKSGASAAVNVSTGAHVISAPVTLASSIAVTSDAGASLTLSGVVSGPGGISKAGDGLLDLTAANTFSGDVTILDGVLSFSQASGLGSGSLTINGGVLAYNPGNTADISGKTVSFGLDGAGIDTGGNDITFANPVGNGGLGAFAKLGEGSLTLLGDNTYTGQTFVKGGELVIAGNSVLGAGTNALNLDGGIVVPTDSISLGVADVDARPVIVGSAGGGFLVADGLTLTVPGAMSGSGQFTKSGSGTLVLTANNSARTGATVIEGGVVRLGNSRPIGQTGLGTGPITIAADTELYLNGAGTNDNGTTFGVLTNAVSVPEGVTLGIHNPARGGYTGVLNGAGNVNLYVDGVRCEVPAQWPAFTGQLTVLKTPTGDGTDKDIYQMTGAQNLANAKVRITAGVEVSQGNSSSGSFNPPNTSPWTTTHNFGELVVDSGAILAGNFVGGRYNAYSIGALNTDSVINGQIRGTANVYGYGYPRIIKVGSGRLTVNNDNMLTSGSGIASVTVDGGVFDIRGSIANHYLSPGADGEYGSGAVTKGADDIISLTQPEGDSVVVTPGTFVVNASGTLAGNGTLGGAITVNGTLRPDSTGSIGGRLKLTGSASLTLASTAVTQFDFGGTAFTGVSSTASGAVTYGGALKLNFLGSVYNNAYTLFQLATAPTGEFAAVTATSAATTEPVTLTNSGGVWTGSIDGAALSFNASTGVLTVTGGATAVLPNAPGGVAAEAGNALVQLTWNAVSGADTYVVKRATTSGGPYTTLASDIGTTAYLDDAVLNGTTYYYVVRAKNAAGLSADSSEVSATPSLPAPAYTDLQSWRYEQFGVYDDDGTVLAGDNEDYDGDGLVNLLEYALGTAPKIANASPVTIGRSGNNLTLTYPRRTPADPALTYTVEVSGDLSGGFTTGLGATTGTGPYVYTDNVDVSAPGARRFLRLNVGYTAPTP